MNLPSALGFFTWLKSFFTEISVTETESDKNPTLEIILDRGKLRLHSGDANYSYGSLQALFKEVFIELEIENRALEKALILGFGAGSVAELLLKSHPSLEIIGVEWDAAILQLYKSYFNLFENKNCCVVEGDAVVYIENYTGPPFDLIIVDLFKGQFVPKEAETDSFLSALDNNLKSDGILLFNRILQEDERQIDNDLFKSRFEEKFPESGWYQALGNEVLIVDR